jgi:GT2 family glycosyltransferase
MTLHMKEPAKSGFRNSGWVSSFAAQATAIIRLLHHLIRGRGWKFLLSLPGILIRLARIWWSSGFQALKAHVRNQVSFSTNNSDRYKDWLKAHTLSPSELAEMQKASGRMAYAPLFSIILPVFNVEERWLRKAIDSILVQAYPGWELCIADDASSRAHVRQVLEEYEARDQRIKVIYRTENGHISAASNSALSIAKGEFVCLMDHDDEISPDALYRFAEALNASPDTDMLFSDEDKIDQHGTRYEPFFKPDWSPEYLETCMATSHFACYRRAIVTRVGGFRIGYEGSQDYDFVLRFAEQTNNIRHVPYVTYHWRSIPQSTASTITAKGYAAQAAVRALADRLNRLGQEGNVTARTFSNSYRIDRSITGNPVVSVIIPSAGPISKVRGKPVDLLANCVRSIREKSVYARYEIIVVNNKPLSAETLISVRVEDLTILAFDEPFNFSKAINLGASRAKGEYLLLLNDDTEAISAGWLTAMLQLAQLEGVGAVGAKLYYEDKTIQHIGVTLNAQGLPDHICRGFPGTSPGYYFSFAGNKNCLAVTAACLMTRKAYFDQVGGLDETFPMNYNDIDYCLRLREKGYRIAWAADAELFHYESRSKIGSVEPEEEKHFLRRWQAVYNRDPYYSVHLDRTPPAYLIRTD